MRDNDRNRDQDRDVVGAVQKWQCVTCGVEARKQGVPIGGDRWIIIHARSCEAHGGTEDVGPVTSANDPDNAYFVATD